MSTQHDNEQWNNGTIQTRIQSHNHAEALIIVQHTIKEERVNGVSIPLQPSPCLVAPSPARKKSKSSNGENKRKARALFQSIGTRAEPLLPYPLDKPLPHALSCIMLQSFLHPGFQGIACVTELLQTMSTINRNSCQ